MNRRQEVAFHATGLVVAGVCVVRGEDDWVVGLLVPILIVGGLAIFALRTKGTAPPSMSSLLVVAGLIAVGLTGRTALVRLGGIESDVDEVHNSVEAIEGQLSELDQSIGTVKDAVEQVRSDVEDLQNR